MDIMSKSPEHLTARNIHHEDAWKHLFVKLVQPILAIRKNGLVIRRWLRTASRVHRMLHRILSHTLSCHRPSCRARCASGNNMNRPVPPDFGRAALNHRCRCSSSFTHRTAFPRSRLTVVGTRVLWMSCRDSRMASGQSANPWWCVACVVVVRSRGSFVVVLVRYSGEADTMCIHQHSRFVRVWLSRRTIDCGHRHLNVKHCVSSRQVRFDMAGVTDAKHSRASYRLLSNVVFASFRGVSCNVRGGDIAIAL